jgi:hypothetical protein
MLFRLRLEFNRYLDSLLKKKMKIYVIFQIILNKFFLFLNFFQIELSLF